MIVADKLKVMRQIKYSHIYKNILLCGLVSMNIASAQSMDARIDVSSALPQAPGFLVADQDPTMPWIPSDYSKENWVQIQLKQPEAIQSVELSWQNGINNCTYFIDLSQDGKRWEQVWQYNGEKSITGASAEFSTPQKVRYIRIRLKGSRQGLSEIRINNRDLNAAFAPKIPSIPENAPYRNASLPAEVRAENVASLMTDYEKFQMAGGYNSFHIRALKRFALRQLTMSDASAGVHVRSNIMTVSDPGTIAYPCSVALAASWDPSMASAYGRALARECRQVGVDILLGPGVNLYRTSTCGRNFEYMGEDPHLAGEMASAYIQGMQNEKVLAVAKHFICNNHEWLRHDSNIIVDDRTLHELYMRPWYDAVYKGRVGAIMSSYNWMNGEKVSCSPKALNGLLRQDIGFNELVMSDWSAAWFSAKVLTCGLDISMPAIKKIPAFSQSISSQSRTNLDVIAKRILTPLFRLGLYDRESLSPGLASERPEWETVALKTAQESITLLKNNGILPLGNESVLVLGPSALKTCYAGGGSGWVEGYDHRNIAPELSKLLGSNNVEIAENWETVSDSQIRSAKTVIVCVDHWTKESTDSYPKLDRKQEQLARRCVNLNQRTVVVVNSGSGIEMDWDDKAAAVVWAYFPGQYGGTAVAEVLTGQVNPSGKLPYTIERRFSDAPAFGYIPEGASWGQKKINAVDKSLPDCPPVEYKEGIFIGYRWYDRNHSAVRYPFGHGLSYTTFEYSNLNLHVGPTGLVVSATIKNTGNVAGSEVVQLYIGQDHPSVDRPVRELKAYKKIQLAPGEAHPVEFCLSPEVLAYYDISQKNWLVESGSYTIDLASSSRDIRLSGNAEWNTKLRYHRPTDAKPL